MAIIIPFRGLLYNPEKVGDLSIVMAPPYDVVTPEFQENLYKRHPNNIVRLILNKTTPEDKPGSDRYSRAARDLRTWVNEGVLIRDKVPAIYYLTQHETTLTGPKEDRLKLIKACNANLSSIFAIYPEPGVSPEDRIISILGSGAAGDPVIEVRGDDNAVNRLWRINDPGVIERVAHKMEAKTLLIADGHHRYETALNYRNMMNGELKNPTGEEPFDFVMMYFSSMEGEGLEVLPIHRVIHSLGGFVGETFVDICQEYFDLEEFSFDESTEPGVREEFFKKIGEGAVEMSRFGLYLKGKKGYYILTLKTKKLIDDIFGDTIPEVYKALDVTVLHSLILKNILGITREDQERQKNIIYVTGLDNALEEGRGGENQMVFFMNPTKVEQVKAVSEAGLLMPQKSTYFYPKLPSGLVINLLD
jgi:uncharacterized protein (DUF1015 family)